VGVNDQTSLMEKVNRTKNPGRERMQAKEIDNDLTFMETFSVVKILVLKEEVILPIKSIFFEDEKQGVVVFRFFPRWQQ